MLIEGTVDVIQNDQKFKSMGAGDFFGEIALVSKTPRTATVKTTSPVRALVINDRAFRALLEHSPQIQLGVLQALAERVAQTRASADLDSARWRCTSGGSRSRRGPDRRGARSAACSRPGWRSTDEVVASTRREERAEELRERHGITVTLSNAEAVAGAALVVIAVKPQDIDALLGEIGRCIQPDQTVLSIAAAIPTASIERHLGDARSGRARDAEHARGRARGDRGDLRRRARRRGAPDARGGGAPPSRRRRARRRAVHGRRHGRVGLRPGVLRAARRGDDRGRDPARPLARDLDAARRPDDARHGEAAARPEDAPGRAARDGHLARAGRRSRRSASSSRPACGPRS